MEGHSPLSDEALVAACRRGDEAAWRALVVRYQRLIYSIPRRAGLDSDLCDDVFQTVFSALVAKLDEIANPSAIRAWLVTTARRETWRFVAARRRDVAPRADESTGATEANEIPDDLPLADEELLQMELQHEMRAAVAALDMRCQELLTLLFYRPDPPPYSEIASALGLREGSIGPTRARCLEKLLRVLEERGM
jgi:RNA polymerase sigma factor (sigma-70 family)